MTYFKEEPADISKYPMPREKQDVTVAKNAKVFPVGFLLDNTIYTSSSKNEHESF